MHNFERAQSSWTILRSHFLELLPLHNLLHTSCFLWLPFLILQSVSLGFIYLFFCTTPPSSWGHENREKWKVKGIHPTLLGSQLLQSERKLFVLHSFRSLWALNIAITATARLLEGWGLREWREEKGFPFIFLNIRRPLSCPWVRTKGILLELSLSTPMPTLISSCV